jgi:hypothetical protein
VSAYQTELHFRKIKPEARFYETETFWDRPSDLIKHHRSNKYRIFQFHLQLRKFVRDGFSYRGMKKKAGHHYFARHHNWSKNKPKGGKRSFICMKPQQFDHDDGQMMSPQQQSRIA